jgi:hypothetical protein
MIEDMISHSSRDERLIAAPVVHIFRRRCRNVNALTVAFGKAPHDAQFWSVA